MINFALPIHISMSNIAMSELRSIAKGRNIAGYKNVSIKELEDLPMSIPIQRSKKQMPYKDL